MKQSFWLRSAKRAVPFIVLGILAYIDYASCYVVAWKQVYHQHLAAAAIIFWTLLASLQVFLLFYWVMIYIRGPGKLPSFQHFDLYGIKAENTTPVPDVFVCDEQGFPFWCSKCQNLKPDRSFHLSDLDVCVPRFDHFCLWIGTAIGRTNFLPFIKFLLFQWASSTLVVCFVAVYTRSILRREEQLLPHFLILFGLCGFIAFFTVTLLIVTIKSTFTNSTALDDITIKQARNYKRWLKKKETSSPKNEWCLGKTPRVELGVRYVNINHDGTRKVVSYSIDNHPYSNGFRANLINTSLKGNYNINSTRGEAGSRRALIAGIVILVPLAEFFFSDAPAKEGRSEFERYSDEISPAFMQKMFSRIEENQFQYALYLSPPAPLKPLE